MVNNVQKAIWDFFLYSTAEKRMFLKAVSRDMSDKEWDTVTESYLRARVHKKTGGTYHITAVEDYMERRFRADMEITPMGMVDHCIFCGKLTKIMRPWAIKAAQRIKNRLRMQKQRDEQRAVTV